MWNKLGVLEGVAYSPSFPFFLQGQGKRLSEAALLVYCVSERLGALCWMMTELVSGALTHLAALVRTGGWAEAVVPLIFEVPSWGHFTHFSCTPLPPFFPFDLLLNGWQECNSTQAYSHSQDVVRLFCFLFPIVSVCPHGQLCCKTVSPQCLPLAPQVWRGTAVEKCRTWSLINAGKMQCLRFTNMPKCCGHWGLKEHLDLGATCH